MDMGMDHRLHDEHLMMIRTIDEDHLHQVAILTHTEAEIHMLDQEVLHQGMAVATADMTMVDIHPDDIGKFSISPAPDWLP